MSVFSAIFLVCVCVCVCAYYCVCVCVLQEPSQDHALSAAGLSSQDLQEAQLSEELHPLSVGGLDLTEHPLGT